MAELPQDYVFVCDLTALPPRGKKTVQISEKSVLIIVCEGGVYAVENVDPQTHGALAKGKVLDCTLTSPNNGAQYDLETGKYLGGGVSPLQSHWLTKFPVRVVDEKVYVHLTA